MVDKQGRNYSYSELADILLQAEADQPRNEKPSIASKPPSSLCAQRSNTLGWLNDARPLLLIGETGVDKNVDV